MSSDYYICHYCSDYMTDSRGDMKKHFSRKIKCYCLTIIPYENAKDLTLNKKFNLKLNISKLEKNDKLFIINNYNDKYNVIDENFKHTKDIKIIKKLIIKNIIMMKMEMMKMEMIKKMIVIKKKIK